MQRNSCPPIAAYKDIILYSLEKCRVVIIAGETGCGKSTYLPQILYNSFDNERICITQPRRIAAVQLSKEVSRVLGQTNVGYAIRFDDRTCTDTTRIKFVTEGILIREILFDNLLEQYSVIIVDEVHERSIQTDIILGLLKCILVKRKTLKVVLCSATLDVATLRDFYDFTKTDIKVDEELTKPAVVVIPVKSYPVSVFYKKDPVPNYLKACVDTAIDIHETSKLASGKILIFVTGQDEVGYVAEQLQDYSHRISLRLDVNKLIVLPMHASLDLDSMSRVFEPFEQSRRACIIATNVAETSLTIPDIAFVIDCGFTKTKILNINTGTDALVRVPTSKSSAKQRAGRAGRTRNGKVYRLYSEEAYEELPNSDLPEIQRCELSETIILLKALGVKNIAKFPFVSPPLHESVVQSLESLYALDLIDDKSQLTKEGKQVARLTLDPKIGKILVGDLAKESMSEVLRIVSMLQVGEIFEQHRGNGSRNVWTNQHLIDLCSVEGDLISYLNIYNAFEDNSKSQKWASKRNLSYKALMEATEIYKKLESQVKCMCSEITSCKGRLHIVAKSLTSGLFLNAACLSMDGNYRTIKGDHIVHLHPLSCLNEVPTKPKYVIYAGIMLTTKSYMRHVMAVEQEWLLDVASHYYDF